MDSKIFLAYDVRGVYPTEINEDVAYQIGKAYADFVKPKTVVLGRDVRISGPALWDAVAKGLTEMGVDVIDVGIIATDMLYFAVSNFGYDGGIIITGSHNPKQYNGIKMVRSGAEAISSENGLFEIRDIAVNNSFQKSDKPGKIVKMDVFEEYIQKIISFVDIEAIKKLKLRVAVNPNFGAAGKTLDRLAEIFDFKLEKLNFEPDGNFPKGRPDPMIPELRMETSRLIKESDSNLGATWDSDADRCFLFDEYGRFVDAYYEGTLLSKIFLSRNKGGKIIHDTRLVWAYRDVAKEFGGVAIEKKAGHSYIKKYMREEDAVFGAEAAGHFYFKDYYYCDNGILPFLFILEEMAKTGKKLSELIDPIRFKYPVSEEVNFKVNNPKQVIKVVEQFNKEGKVEHIDGLSVEYEDWRFNLRPSNTGEVLVRLNVEAKTREILDPMKAEIIKNIKSDIASK